MGFLSTVRDALALPALASQPVPLASPWADSSHLLPVTVDPSLTADRDRGPVSRSLAMSVPALARARRLIVGSIARLPMEATRNGELLPEQPRFLSRTDGPISPFHRMIWTIDDLMFYGWSLWALERDAEDRVIAADRVPFASWSFDADGNVVYDGSPVDPRSVCLIPGLDEGILTTGSTPIRHAADLGRSAARAARTPIAHTELHQTGGEPLNNEQIRSLVNGWIAARRSADGAVSFTNPSIEVKTHGTYDAQLLVEGRGAAAVDIARITGIPSVMLDAAAADTTMRYSNVDARNTEFIDFCLAPLMACVAARLGMDDIVPRGTAIRFDVSDLTGTAVTDLDTPDDNHTTDPLPETEATP